MVNNAETATVRELKMQGQGPVASLGCLASTTFVYRCTWSPTGTATVSFVPGKSAWTTTVTLGP